MIITNNIIAGVEIPPLKWQMNHSAGNISFSRFDKKKYARFLALAPRYIVTDGNKIFGMTEVTGDDRAITLSWTVQSAKVYYMLPDNNQKNRLPDSPESEQEAAEQPEAETAVES